MMMQKIHFSLVPSKQACKMENRKIEIQNHLQMHPHTIVSIVSHEADIENAVGKFAHFN